jgi:hypothetical protein
MAFTAKDGKAFGNRQQQKAYDERAPKKESKPMPENANEAGENENGENSPEDIHEMVAEHGPAEKVEISHAEGKHTKVSHHGGKMHKSEHASAEEAHHAGMTAAGVEPGGQQQEPAMAGAGAMQPGAIPGM